MSLAHADVGLLHLQHLTAHDRDLLGAATGLPVEPPRVVTMLGDERVARAVFGARGDEEPFLRASPFLTFAVAVHRAAADLATVSFTQEWVGPRSRVPVFDVGTLRDLVADPLRRLLLVELLASYTKVASGATWVHTRRGWRRRRFSELDPVRLAELIEVVGEAERPGVYRRLGDLALFLTGVFPDHTAERGLGVVDQARLTRLSGGPAAGTASGPGELPSAVAQLGTVGLLEHLGARWYALAARTAPQPLLGTAAAVPELSRRFRDARRVLNYVTDRTLFPFRDRWFGLGNTG